MHVHLDFETKSKNDIKLGLAQYFAADGEADIICMGYAFEGEKPELWWAKEKELPLALELHLFNEGLVYAHNAIFEYLVWNEIGVPKYGFPELKLHQLVDTMALCAQAAIPQSLEAAGEALGMPADKQKSKRGKYLIRECCVPPFNEDPELLRELGEYCIQDVVAERAIANALPKLI